MDVTHIQSTYYLSRGENIDTLCYFAAAQESSRSFAGGRDGDTTAEEDVAKKAGC